MFNISNNLMYEYNYNSKAIFIIYSQFKCKCIDFHDFEVLVKL